jgi:hypothetical protein
VTERSSAWASASGSPAIWSSGRPRRSGHERDRLGEQPPGDEAEHLGRGPVEPLHVVDHAEQRALGRDVGQQAEHGQRDQEAFGRAAVAGAEDRLQGRTLRRRQLRQPIEERVTEPVQCGVRKFGLGREAGRAQDP